MSQTIRRNIKKINAAEAGRKHRESVAVKLAKDKREQGIQKKRHTTAAMDQSAIDAIVCGTVPTPENIGRYRIACASEDYGQQLEGVTAIRKLLSIERDPPVCQVLNSGVLPCLVRLLQSPNHAVQLQAAWAVTNIASTDYTNKVVEANAIPGLIQGMMCEDANVRDQCLWCIGNIAGDSTKHRDLLITTPGAIQSLFVNIEHPDSIGLLRNAAWTLSNFCRGKPSPPVSVVQPILPALAYLVSHEDAEVKADGCWAISYLTDGDEGINQAVVESGLVSKCVSLATHADLKVIVPSLRVIGNVISGNDKQTQAALDAGALAVLEPLLSHPKRNVRREAAWAVSNVAAGTKAQIAQLMTVPKLMPSVINLLRSSEWHVRKEAAWVVSNIATVGATEHVCQLVSLGVIEPLTEILENNDARMLCVVLDAIAAILAVGQRLSQSNASQASAYKFADMFESCGLLNQLETLQAHSMEDVYAKSYSIMEKYFDVEETCENNATLPTVTQNGTFAFGTPTQPTGQFQNGETSKSAGFAMDIFSGFNAPSSATGKTLQQSSTPIPQAFNFDSVQFM